MMTTENLPLIEGGTSKQKMFAESVRLKFIIFAEENLVGQLQVDAEIVIRVRVDYKWWIDRANKITIMEVKKMISSAKSTLTRAGSVEAALEAQRTAITAKKNYPINTAPLGGILRQVPRN